MKKLDMGSGLLWEILDQLELAAEEPYADHTDYYKVLDKAEAEVLYRFLKDWLHPEIV